MGRYRKILVAFDGSASSANALRQAINLARAEQSWIKVVAVVPTFEGEIEIIGVRDVDAVIKGPAEKLIAEAKAIAKAEGASILTDVEHGEAYERIVDVASAENCDLIVMGRSGHGRVARAFVGSVTARVIGHTDRDVLVVPATATVGWGRILVATDGSRYSTVAVEHAMNIAALLGSELTVVAVADVNEEFYAQAPDEAEKVVMKAKAIAEEVAKRATEAGVKATALVKEGEPYEAITAAAAATKAEIIVMGSHGRTGLKRLLMGSVTEKVIGHAACPVLVTRL